MTLYDAKGTVKEVRSFDCNGEGEVLEKRKNEMQVCKWEKLDANTLTKALQTFDEDGKTERWVQKFALPDTLMLEWASYDGNNMLKRKSTYDKSLDKPLTHTWYRKGQPYWEWTYAYKDELLTTKTGVTEGKVVVKMLYTYNADKLLDEVKTYNKNNLVSRYTKMGYVK